MKTEEVFGKYSPGIGAWGVYDLGMDSARVVECPARSPWATALANAWGTSTLRMPHATPFDRQENDCDFTAFQKSLDTAVETAPTSARSLPSQADQPTVVGFALLLQRFQSPPATIEKP